MAQSVLRIHLPVQETTLVWDDPMEKEMTTQSNILAWETPWTQERPVGSNPMGLQRVGHDLATKQQQSNINQISIILVKEQADSSVNRKIRKMPK